VLDNDYGTWRAYKNRYWPHKFLIDIDGFIVYDHIGEGAYDETEQKIQELLQERLDALGMKEHIGEEMATPVGVESADFRLLSPETYFGAARNTNFGNGESQQLGMQTLRAPEKLSTSTLYLNGTWNFEKEFAENKNASKIIFKYTARNVFLVASADEPLEITVLRDGKPLDSVAGRDIVMKNGKSTATVYDARLYRLVEDADYGEHALEIMIEKPGLRAYTFTFG